MQQATPCSIFSRQTYPLWNTLIPRSKQPQLFHYWYTQDWSLCRNSVFLISTYGFPGQPSTDPFLSTNFTEHSLSWEAYSSSASKKFSTFYETQSFITAFTKACGVCAWYVHTHCRFKITLPNTDQAHKKYLWATTSNFSQAQLSTPW